MNILRCLALLFTFLFLMENVPAQVGFFPEDLIVNASTLNLRDRPDKSGKVVEKLPRGTELSLLDVAGDGQYEVVDSTNGVWLRVQHKSKTGYVFSAHVIGAYNLYQEGDGVNEPLPSLNWYGVYLRDSFSDELRPIQVRLERQYMEFYDDTITVLLTNQPETSKFLLGTVAPLTTGLVSNLGIFDPGALYTSNELSPGGMLPIYPGQELDDTTAYHTYFLAAVGCASFDETDYVKVTDYRVYAFESVAEGSSVKQDITGWVHPEEGINPSVNLIWFGDLDHDRKPDALIQDAPYEAGMRMSLFLSSKARPGEYLHKVCEYFFPID